MYKIIKNFEKFQEHDRRKNEYAKTNNIRLLRLTKENFNLLNVNQLGFLINNLKRINYD